MISAFFNLVNTLVVVATAVGITGVITKPDDTSFLNYLKFQVHSRVRPSTSIFDTLKVRVVSGTYNKVIESGEITITDHIFLKTAVFNMGGHQQPLHFVGCLNNWYSVNETNRVFEWFR